LRGNGWWEGESPDEDRSVKVWSWPDGRLLGILRGHVNMVIGLAETPNSLVVISASADATIDHGRSERRLVG
jgi:WD40 repeat protein